jgi:hypothetical protein
MTLDPSAVENPSSVGMLYSSSFSMPSLCLALVSARGKEGGRMVQN